MASKKVNQEIEERAHQFLCVRLFLLKYSMTLLFEFQPLPVMKSLRFYSTLYCIHGLLCTEAGNMREIKHPYSAPRSELMF